MISTLLDQFVSVHGNLSTMIIPPPPPSAYTLYGSGSHLHVYIPTYYANARAYMFRRRRTQRWRFLGLNVVVIVAGNEKASIHIARYFCVCIYFGVAVRGGGRFSFKLCARAHTRVRQFTSIPFATTSLTVT